MQSKRITFMSPNIELPPLFTCSSTTDVNKSLYYNCKRIFDVILASIALVILTPLLLLVALAIHLDSPGPVLFRQQRMGYDWRNKKVKPFIILKFRTMTDNCNQNVHKEYVRQWINATQSPTLAKVANDTRVTRLGRFLRHTSIDELPQLINVLRGEMSLVGPRPVPLYEIACYQDPHYRRLEAMPGLTGWWQVTARSTVSFEEMVRLDVWYIEHQSLWLDLWIICLTPFSVLNGKITA